jgi:prepilin-type N-terminal cleavage/methylation domain-containing protein
MSKIFSRRTFPLTTVWIKIQKCPTRRKAFTLIELLVVVSIIALLLSILMPGQLKAKQHALQMVCRTNLHNYGIASKMYLSDYDEKFMDPWTSIYKENSFPGEVSRYCRWHNPAFSLEGNEEYQGPLWTYLEEEDIILCPVFAQVGAQFGVFHNPSSCIGAPFDPQFSYSQNAYLGATGPDYGWLEGGVAKASEVNSPAGTFFFGEENTWQMNTGAPTWNGEPYDITISRATLNDTALLTRFNKNDLNAANDAFGTFHSPPNGDYNLGTTNAVMLDGSITAVSPYNDGTFRKAWPGLKDGVSYRPDNAPDGAKLP